MLRGSQFILKFHFVIAVVYLKLVFDLVSSKATFNDVY